MAKTITKAIKLKDIQDLEALIEGEVIEAELHEDDFRGKVLVKGMEKKEDDLRFLRKDKKNIIEYIISPLQVYVDRVKGIMVQKQSSRISYIVHPPEDPLYDCLSVLLNTAGL